ncbi:MAG: UDP-N-acetylglucosamine:LPS N-acetylglucosamine transferase [Candidatus Pacebacteria bacterium GW2011_GWF2_38_9]|nr:MAG: UDP-N-acetylglucosamine:LPS N-acetylglucosamine transferase [candidate division TM6 bacterium GW2011_GWF2_28_16]KKQ08774.1 MAG: UDP-N-acetylglucosamine:LPS N-acetylglucosamine transferase [Candidatus Pacebacteria bacterium GW2011_GWF1_36_5]KKQ88413.1 MAG: UDP-N-acetylglucosamine:LPS N-acetylglucosamine transferase [Candidatus Pacebacteria bacterium GW2011_GWF2_38_9]HAZ73030.1 hypothetical protein [Candidatus Paceibacterota bacterium]
MKTIGIFTSIYGHESIAKAIAEKIEENAKNKYSIKIFFIKRSALDLTYDYLFKINPTSIGSSFHWSSKITQKDKSARKLADAYFLMNYDKEITDFIKKNKINLCISTYFECNPILEKFQQKGIPFINIVTDPKTVHSLTISEKADSNFVFDDYLVKQYKNKNMKKAGWFIRSKFENNYDRKTIRKKLKISNDLTFLIVSGSEGSNAILKILPTIINCEQKVNFIISCGKNKFLYNNMLGIKQSFDKFSSSKAEIIPLYHTSELHLYMQAADLIVGKAGPNTLFESVACEKPFFAITHIHGQEDGNLDIIRDFKIGIVEENAKKANKELAELIENPEKISDFTKNIKKLKAYNQNSINILLKEIDRLLN